MSRIEFSKDVKKQARARSGDACEAEGPLYGHRPGVRCGEDMRTKGYRYDHINPVEQSQDATLGNCLVVCPTCHDFKTRTRDIPMLAKGRRIAEKREGLRPSSRPMPCGRNSPLKKKMNGEVVRRT